MHTSKNRIASTRRSDFVEDTRESNFLEEVQPVSRGMERHCSPAQMRTNPSERTETVHLPSLQPLLLFAHTPME